MIVNDKRSETEIIHELLFTAQTDIKKTQLMYKTNMTYFQLNKYLDFMLEKGLIKEKERTSDGKIYYTTDKGKELLESIDIVFTYLK